MKRLSAYSSLATSGGVLASHKDAVMSFDKDRAEVRLLTHMLRGRCLPAAYASRKPGAPQNQWQIS